MSRLRSWTPAFVAALALYGLPYALLGTLTGGGLWWLPLVADVLLLAAVAIFLWSPLVVLAAAVVSAIFAGLVFVAASAASTCGTSTTATVVEIAGGALLALALGSWGVRRGPRVLWTIPVGWVVYGVWIVVWAHLIPHGAGGCFE